MKKTWKQELQDEMQRRNDSGPVLAYAPSEEAWDMEYQSHGYFVEEPALLAWTMDRVYFVVAMPDVVMGREYSDLFLDSVPRDPQPVGQSPVQM